MKEESLSGVCLPDSTALAWAMKSKKMTMLNMTT